MQGEYLSQQQIKEQLSADYRVALCARMATDAIADLLPPTCRHSEVAQVALSHFVRTSDVVIGQENALALALRKKNTTLRDFFCSVFTAETSASSHNLLYVALGSLLADKALRQEPNGITFCCVDMLRTSLSDLFDAINFALSHALPLNIIVWNDNDHLQHAVLQRRLRGFVSSSPNVGLQIETVQGKDYAALCQVFKRQVDKVTQLHCTTLTIVETSNSADKHFASWLVEKQVLTDQQAETIRSDCKHVVDKAKRDAYFASVMSENGAFPKYQLLDITSVITSLTNGMSLRPMPLPPMPHAISLAVGIAQQHTDILPIVQVSVSDTDLACLHSLPPIPLVLRTLDLNIGTLLTALPAIVEVYTPAYRSEATNILHHVLANSMQALVVEAGSTTTELSAWTWDTRACRSFSTGEDITILTYGRQTLAVVDALAMLAEHNVHADAIHIAQLRPAQWVETITTSLRKTKRLGIVAPSDDDFAIHYILSSLATQSSALRHVVHSQIISPQKHGQQLVAHDICKQIISIINDN